MLRSVVAYLLATALLLVSSSAFRQALSEFRDTEPGSLFLGVLQLVIGTSAVATAFGLVKRARWAAWSAAISGVAAAGLLAVQPLLAPMDSEAQRAIGLGAAVVLASAAGVSWFARRIARHDLASLAATDQAFVRPASPVRLPEGQRPAEPIIARAPDAHVPRVAGTQRHDSHS